MPAAPHVADLQLVNAAGVTFARSEGRVRSTVAAWIALAALSFYFLASWEIRPLFFSNQNTYFLQGLRMAGVAGLQHDWLSATRAPHVVFSVFIAALQRSGHLAVGVHAAEAVLYAALVWSFWTISACQHQPQRRDVALRFIACAVFLILMTERGPWHVLFTWIGLADQYVFGGYLQPSEFGIAMVVALACVAIGRRHLAIVLLVIAATFHASYLLPCGVLALCIAADALRQRGAREAAILLALFGLGVLPIVIYGLSFGGDPADVARANALLARHIIPQHAWPAFWFSSGSLLKLAVMLAGCAAAWWCLPRSIATAMAASLALIAGGIAFVYFTNNEFLGLLFPWRASAWLYPFAVFTLVVASVEVVWRLISRGGAPLPEWLPVAGALALGLLISAEAVRELRIHRTGPQFPFAHEAVANSSDADVIIIPQADDDLWNRFRLLTQRAVYVDRKSHPYLAAEVLEWQRRREAAERFYTLPPERRARECRELGATAYVSEMGAHAEDGGLAIVHCSQP